MLVFSDTSPISCLASLGRLDLLEMYGQVRIVPAVEEELSRHPSESARALIQEAFERGLLRRDAGKMEDATSLLLEHELDRGEAEALAVAKASRADLVFIDEREGRKWARRLGVPAVGTLGILLRAKCDGRLDSVGSAMHELTRTYGFAISPVLLQRALAQVGEAG
jgi:predicted nucleic acid-binding protein